MKVGLCVPSLNDGPGAVATAFSVIAAEAGSDVELVVVLVDDGSVSGLTVRESVSEPWLKIVSFDQRRGQVRARSAGHDYLVNEGCSYVLQLDAYCNVAERHVSRLVEDAERHGAAVVGSGSRQAQEGEVMAGQVLPPELAVPESTGQRLEGVLYEPAWAPLRRVRGSHEVWLVVAHGMLVAADIGERAFPKRAGLYGYDEIWPAFAAWEQGRPVRVVPEAVVGHVFRHEENRYYGGPNDWHIERSLRMLAQWATWETVGEVSAFALHEGMPVERLVRVVGSWAEETRTETAGLFEELRLRF